MTNPRHTARKGLGTVALVVVVLGSACSSNSSQPASSSTATRVANDANIMVEGQSHTIAGKVECRTSTAQPSATPTESGNQTTRISAQDDSASLELSLSDLKPPDVNGFAITLNTGSANYRMPFQPGRQVQATINGRTYTVTGMGQAFPDGQGTMRELSFGVHVTCP